MEYKLRLTNILKLTIVNVYQNLTFENYLYFNIQYTRRSILKILIKIFTASTLLRSIRVSDLPGTGVR